MSPMKDIQLFAIATVTNDRIDLDDDDWGSVISTITLSDALSPDLLIGLESFSHVEIIFYFDQLAEGRIHPPTRYPRNNPKWPKLGLLAQRSAHHPNPIGLTVARIIGVEGRSLIVLGLDAVNGTPVLDIKPVFQEFLPDDVKQAAWVSELMEDYWDKS